MLLENRKAISFDLTEIMRELEIPDTKYIPLKPLEIGCHVPDLVLKKEQINKHRFLSGAGAGRSVLLRQIAGRPLVISFYSAEWKAYGLNHLKYLNRLQKEIKALGGNLLIISSDEDAIKLEELIWDHSLELNFYFDQGNAIADQFGLYSEMDPAWNKYPGIEVNVPLLATYVISNGEVVYHYIDHQLQGPGLEKDLLEAVTKAYFLRKSA
ncbi:MAG: redoxin domain-containing protein [Mucilaginibacter sp.]